MDVELGEYAVELTLVEFVTALFGPLGGEVGMGAIDGMGDLEEVLFGVVDVDDLDGVGGILAGPVPDPGGAVTEDDALGDLIEAAASGFTEHAAGKGGGRGVGVAAGDAFDSGIAGDRIGVAHGQAVFVSGLGGPDDTELGFRGFGGAVGLFALASLGFGVAHGDAGAVESEIEGGSLCGFEFEDLAFIEGNGLTEGLGKTLHLLGVDVETGEFAQEVAGLGEADPRRAHPGHAQGCGRQRGSFQAKGAVTRTEARVAVLAVIPGALPFHLAQGGGEGLGSAAGVVGHRAARTRLLGSLMVAVVGIEAMGDGLGRNP